MPDYIKVTLANGEARHLPIVGGSRHSGMAREALDTAFGQIVVRSAEGTMVVAAHIVEAELALDHDDIHARGHSEYL